MTVSFFGIGGCED